MVEVAGVEVETGEAATRSRRALRKGGMRANVVTAERIYVFVALLVARPSCEHAVKTRPSVRPAELFSCARHWKTGGTRSLSL